MPLFSLACRLSHESFIVRAQMRAGKMLFEPYMLAGLSGRPPNGPQKGKEEPLGKAARGKELPAARQMTVPHAQVGTLNEMSVNPDTANANLF